MVFGKQKLSQLFDFTKFAAISNVSLDPRKIMERNTNLQKILKILALIILVVSFIGLIIIIVLYIISHNIPDVYSVVIDAGSTSSKLHLYKWIDEPFRSNGKVDEVTNEKVLSIRESLFAHTHFVNPFHFPLTLK